MIKVAHVSGLIPEPFQLIETNVTVTLAIDAMVIQPK